MFIGNYSQRKIELGVMVGMASVGNILIQIKDPHTNFITPLYKEDFSEIHQFSFADTSDESEINTITENDAEKLANILKSAKENNKNVIVHCHMGICRSGAVVEAATLIGFEVFFDSHHRIPNTLVLNKIRKHLGVLNSWE